MIVIVNIAFYLNYYIETIWICAVQLTSSKFWLYQHNNIIFGSLNLFSNACLKFDIWENIRPGNLKDNRFFSVCKVILVYNMFIVFVFIVLFFKLCHGHSARLPDRNDILTLFVYGKPPDGLQESCRRDAFFPNIVSFNYRHHPCNINYI